MWKKVFCVEVEKFDGTKETYGRKRLESDIKGMHQDILKEMNYGFVEPIKPRCIRKVSLVCQWVKTEGESYD